MKFAPGQNCRFCRNLVLASIMALAALKERVDIWTESHPPLATPWQDSQLRAKEVLELLEEILQSVELDGELWVPRLGAIEAGENKKPFVW